MIMNNYDHRSIIMIIAAHLSSSSCSASSLSLWVKTSFSFSKLIISWWWGWLSWWSMDNLLMIMAIMVITVRMMMVIITMIVVKIIFLPSLRSWTPPEFCQCWPSSLRRGSSSSCPAPLSENGLHDGEWWWLCLGKDDISKTYLNFSLYGVLNMRGGWVGSAI